MAERTKGRALNRAETADMARRIGEMLADPDAGLSTTARHRWEGALAVLEAVLGRAPSMIPEDPERFIL